MGITALLSPAIVRATAVSLGLEAARLDIHPTTHGLVLTILQEGRPIHIDVPTGVTFKVDEICELLLHKSSSTVDSTRQDLSANQPAKTFTHLNAIPTAVATSPP